MKRSGGYVVLFGLSCCTALSAMLLGIVGWRLHHAHDEFSSTLAVIMRAERLGGRIVHLDEALTMSALMAAATGDSKWETRFREAEDSLAEALKEVKEVAADEGVRFAVVQTDAANRKLVELESRALELARGGEEAAAMALLGGEEYGRLKEAHSAGIRSAVELMRSRARRRVEANQGAVRSSWAAAVVALIVLGGAWSAALGLCARHARARERAQERVRTASEELERQVEQRTAALTASEARLRMIMDTAPEGIIICDEDGRMVSFNKAAEQMYGYAASEVIGRGYDMLLPYSPAAPLREYSQRYYEAAGPHIVGVRSEDQGLRRNGEVFPIELHLNRIESDGARFYTAIVRDVTERKCAQELLAERSRTAQLIADVGVALTRHESLRGMLGACTDAVVAHLDAAFARIWTFNEAEQVLELQASSGMYTHLDGGHARVGLGQFKIGRIAQDREPHLTNDVPTDPNISDREWARRAGMAAFAGYPLVVEEELIGVMAVFSRHVLSPVVLDVMAAIADGVALGIKRKKSERDLAELQQELLSTSRRAGMAEVANNVLHNVGNVLNSLNVAASVVVDHVERSQLSGLSKAAAMLKAHRDDPGRLFAEGGKGRQLSEYLITLDEVLTAEQRALAGELQVLSGHIEHIKGVVARQQQYAGEYGVIETVEPAAVVDDALRVNEAALRRHGIEVVRECGDLRAASLDKHRLLQILVNLIRNAKDAMKEAPAERKVLTVGLEAVADGRLRVSIRDRGVGIERANLERIFAHGFTTKQGGHGFGLHSSALAAGAMGGTLTAYSDGRGTGACFVLEVPMAQAEVIP